MYKCHKLLSYSYHNKVSYQKVKKKKTLKIIRQEDMYTLETSEETNYSFSIPAVVSQWLFEHLRSISLISSTILTSHGFLRKRITASCSCVRTRYININILSNMIVSNFSNFKIMTTNCI